MSSLGINRDRCFVLWSSLRRTLPRTSKYFERYNDFKCALRQHRKFFANSTPNFGKVTVARYEFEMKHCLTLKINQYIFIRRFENMSPCSAKLISNILEGFYLPVHIDDEHKGRNDMQCPFIHQSC